MKDLIHTVRFYLTCSILDKLLPGSMDELTSWQYVHVIGKEYIYVVLGFDGNPQRAKCVGNTHARFPLTLSSRKLKQTIREINANR